MLDDDLEYVSHSVDGIKITIYCQSKCGGAKCPYCGMEANKVHSVYERNIQDLPIQGKKVKIVLMRRKYFCANAECVHKTFAERFKFFDGMARKTKRLETEILRVSLSQSSVSAA